MTRLSSKIRRVIPALSWRARLGVLRFKHGVLGALFGRASFGARTEIRRGFHLNLGDNAILKVGSDCILDRDLTIEVGDGAILTIGANTIFGHHCTLAAFEKLEIGANCLLAEMVSVRDHNHRFDDLEIPIRAQGASRAPVKIGDGVWLGAKVSVLKGVVIGEGAIVGANAVVTKNLPARAIAVGIPARVVKMRGEENQSKENQSGETTA